LPIKSCQTKSQQHVTQPPREVWENNEADVAAEESIDFGNNTLGHGTRKLYKFVLKVIKNMDEPSFDPNIWPYKFLFPVAAERKIVLMFS